MPGSMTIGHTDTLVMLSHDDAEHLASVLAGLSALAAGGHLSTEQLAALGAGGTPDRAALATWSRTLAGYLRDHL
ncbi:hypothetical protein [Kitasatospora cineracea]|jgi:hypothetical protein|uniref:Uncharacterized protein n=1 Tax=Kitasatospora cineracea TaxID=88074 RepID=A0A3N4SC81_9ACTN|nr:hypothetical protein [Kitasatospora cineracea]MDR3034440.1 hypothetical protein [Kitasatospora sp.]ROR43700.1 hypothetical protein EDD39_1869 [Kitasatospora cineracea]RPE34044.1 hypothetical protein EDD38_2354 [Kitasatospora cineracea]